jgi:hypothetical protein
MSKLSQYWNERKLLLKKMVLNNTVTSVKCLLLLDNIHDWGKPVTGFDNYCKKSKTTKCFVTIVINILNIEQQKITKIENLFIIPMFDPGWEKEFLIVLYNVGTGIKLINNIKFNKIFMSNKNNYCWASDAIDKKESKTKTKLENAINNTKTQLITGYLDACPSNQYIKSSSEALLNAKKFMFTIPGITQGNTKYELKNNIFTRVFPSKLGKGSNWDNEKRTCTKKCKNKTECTCDWNRVDSFGPNNDTNCNTSDSLNIINNNLITYLNKFVIDRDATYEDFEFFVTLKTYGDVAQVVEASYLNCWFQTTDSMQFILGCKFGCKMLKTYSTNPLQFFIFQHATFIDNNESSNNESSNNE